MKKKILIMSAAVLCFFLLCLINTNVNAATTHSGNLSSMDETVFYWNDGDVINYIQTSENGSNKEYTVYVAAGATVTFDGRLQVTYGDTLNIICEGSATFVRRNCLNSFFYMYGTLNIEAPNGQLTIDGGSKKTVTRSAISIGAGVESHIATMTLNNVRFLNCWNVCSEVDRDPSQTLDQDATVQSNFNSGGAIGSFGNHTTRVDITLNGCVFDNCRANHGSAIMLADGVNGTLTLNNTVIKNCVAYGYVGNTDEVGGGTIRTNGEGGVTLTLDHCIMTDNYSGYSDSNKAAVYDGTDGHGPCAGGAVYWESIYKNSVNAWEKSKLIIIDSQLVNNHANYSGGAIYNEGAVDIGSNESTYDWNLKADPQEIKGTLIKGNSAGGYTGALPANSPSSNGGGISTAVSDLVLDTDRSGAVSAMEEWLGLRPNAGVLITENQAPYGGGIGATVSSSYGSLKICNVVINGAEIKNNTATEQGGGLYVSTCDGMTLNVDIKSGSIAGNKAPNGAGIFQNSGNVNISGGSITDNIADSWGGGLYVNGGVLTMSGGTVKSCIAGLGGGAFVSHGTINLTGGAIDSCEATANGGGVYVHEDATLIIDGGTVKSCTANHGGGVYVNGGVLTLSNGTINSCNAIWEGGGVRLEIGTVNITGGSIIGCGVSSTDYAYGGGVYIKGGDLTLSGGSIEGCEALASGASDAYGGGVYIAGGTLTINGGSIENCTATTDATAETDETHARGGGVCAEGGTLTIKSGTLKSCTATYGGGAYIRSSDAQINMTGGSIDECNAGRSGGGIYVDDHATAIMSGGRIMSCNAETGLGGAVYITTSGTFTMTADSLFDSCTASSLGGGVFMTANAEFTMKAEGNKAPTIQNCIADQGAGVFVRGSSFTMESGAIQNNGKDGDRSVTHYAGGIFMESGELTVGIESCTKDSPDHIHDINAGGVAHPVINGNGAEYGGGIQVSGVEGSEAIVTVYCGDISGNTAAAGKGDNVFLNDGTITYHQDGADIGEMTDHGVIAVNGTISVAEQTDNVEVIYHSGIETNPTPWRVTVPNNYVLNLPYCVYAWQTEKEQEGLIFIGWTTRSDVTEIRNDKGYKNEGECHQVVGDSSNEVHLYALWVRKESKITYLYSFDGRNILSGNPSGIFDSSKKTYTFTKNATNITTPIPVADGYEFLYWRVYASADTASNWDKDYEDGLPAEVAQLKNEKYDLSTSVYNKFGDIVMVAVFKYDVTGTVTAKADDHFSAFAGSTSVTTASDRGWSAYFNINSAASYNNDHAIVFTSALPADTKLIFTWLDRPSGAPMFYYYTATGGETRLDFADFEALGQTGTKLNLDNASADTPEQFIITADYTYANMSAQTTKISFTYQSPNESTANTVCSADITVSSANESGSVSVSGNTLTVALPDNSVYEGKTFALVAKSNGVLRYDITTKLTPTAGGSALSAKAIGGDMMIFVIGAYPAGGASPVYTVSALPTGHTLVWELVLLDSQAQVNTWKKLSA